MKDVKRHVRAFYMNSPNIPARPSLGESLRTLMERRDLTGLILAERVGISPTSVSRIFNGVSRPRQGTLTKLIEVLCQTPEDQQLILRAYSGLPDVVEEEPASFVASGDLPTGELDRIARYLELKTLSIDFRESVARVLRESGIACESYARNGNVVTDFLVGGPVRTAIECKFNVNRDWEREVGTAQLLRTYLPCDRVLVVVPYFNDLARDAIKALSSRSSFIVSVQDLAAALRAPASGGAA